MERLVQILVDAVSVGSLYALTALGIGLIFGVMRLINFAHGELITLAAYALLGLSGMPVPVMIFGAIAVAVLLALITERAAFRPLRNADPTTLLISSFAVSFFLQKLLILVVGSRLKGLDFLPELARQTELFGIRLQLLQIVTIVVGIVLLVALTWFLRATRLGLHMRAAAEDFRMARVLGVRANNVIAMAFALSGLLAAAVSCLIVVQTGVVQPRMGVQLVDHRLRRHGDWRSRQSCQERRSAASWSAPARSCCKRCCRPIFACFARPSSLSPSSPFCCSVHKD